MRIFKFIAAIAITATLTACASTQQNIQKGFDSNFLSYTVGKQYTKIAATSATQIDKMFGVEPAYGNLIAQSASSSGDIIYKHAARREAETTTTDFGIFGGNQARIDYGLF